MHYSLIIGNRPPDNKFPIFILHISTFYYFQQLVQVFIQSNKTNRLLLIELLRLGFDKTLFAS